MPDIRPKIQTIAPASPLAALTAEEKTAIEHFLEQHPESRYAEQVWSHLAQIKNGLRNGC